MGIVKEYATGPVRRLLRDERLVWGACPVCGAQHGQACNPRFPTEGFAHVARLTRAPKKVQEIGIE